MPGKRVEDVLAAVLAAGAQHRRRISTATLNMVLKEATQWKAPPMQRGSLKKGKIYYATQVGGGGEEVGGDGAPWVRRHVGRHAATGGVAWPERLGPLATKYAANAARVARLMHVTAWGRRNKWRWGGSREGGPDSGLRRVVWMAGHHDTRATER